VTGFELTPVGSLPIGKGLSLFARAGLVFWHSDISYRFAVPGSGTQKESGTSLALSLGAHYAFSKQWGARAEYSLYAIDKAKAGAGGFGVMSLSGTFAF
jgi:opacity protein-like surface antigen